MSTHSNSEKPDLSSDNSDALRADLEQTRERVSQDVEALGAKLSPDNLKAEAKQAVSRTVRRGTDRLRDGVDSAQGSILEFCRENPVPLSLIGAGIGLLFWNSRKKSDRRYASPDYSVVGRSEVYEDWGDGESDASSKLGQLKDRVQHGVQRARRAAGDKAHEAMNKFEQLEHTARDQAQHARQLADQTFEDQPLVLGAVALGAGLAVGLSLPATDSENRLVGEYRERFVANAKRRVSDLGGVAQHAVERAQDVVKEELMGGAEQGAAE